MQGNALYQISSKSCHPDLAGWHKTAWQGKVSCQAHLPLCFFHYNDVIMSAMASQISILTIVYSSVYSGADQSKHQSSALLACVSGIHRWSVNSPHKVPVTRKMFPCDDVIMDTGSLGTLQEYFGNPWKIIGNLEEVLDIYPFVLALTY